MKFLKFTIPPTRSVVFLLWIVVQGMPHTPLFSQSYHNLKGIITDAETGLPLENVNVFCRSTGVGAVSDADGYFSFQRLSIGQVELLFSAVGYKDSVLTVSVSSAFGEWVAVQLKPVLYFLEPVIVAADRSRLRIEQGKMTYIYRLDSLSGNSTNVAEVLKEVPGIIVSENGNGMVRVNLAGAESKRVTVMLDGLNLTNPQTGESNLQAVPAGAIEEIELIPGSSVSEKGSTGGGTIVLKSRGGVDDELNLASSIKSFGGKIDTHFPSTGDIRKQNSDGFNQSVFLRKSLSESSAMTLSWSYQAADNQYNYRYDDEIISRRHNKNIIRNYYLTFNTTWPKYRLQKFLISLLGHSAHYQLPSYYYNTKPYEMATSDEKSNDLYASGVWAFSKKLILTTDHQFKRVFVIADGSRELPFFRQFLSENKSISFINSGKLSWNTSPSGPDIEIGFRHEKYSMNQMDLLRQNGSEKNNLSASIAFTTINWGKDLKIFKTDLAATLSSVKYNHHKLNFLKGLLLKFTRKKKNAAIGFWVEHHEAYQFPSLNDLFWTGSARATGNPDLEPELASGLRSGLESEHSFYGRHAFSITYFDQKVAHYIAWQPDFAGIWKPHNLYSTRFSGMELSYTYYNKKGVRFTVNYMTQSPRNKTASEANYFNKYIPYVFLSQLKAALSGKLKRFMWRVDVRKNSRRYTNFYNTPGTEASPFTVWNVEAGFRQALGPVLSISKFKILNFFNETYDLIVGYPMPGRTYVYQLNFNL